jgi:hypothetical protein
VTGSSVIPAHAESGRLFELQETNLDAGFHRHDEIPTRMMARGMNGF